MLIEKNEKKTPFSDTTFIWIKTTQPDKKLLM